jgi:7-carboxy-7-deazaguanine synthase
MFGKNAIVKQHLDPTGRLKVKQVFPTIQGEGPHAGCTAVFVRLAGCNLRCFYCDTDFEGGYEIEVEALVRQVTAASRACAASLVVITGGEPLIQNIKPFVDALTEIGFDVQIETAGTVWVPELDHVDIVCSPKTGSVHPEIEARCMNYKYIVSADNLAEDGLPGFSTQQEGKVLKLYRPTCEDATIWVQPMDSYDAKVNRDNLDAAVKACYKHGYRLSFQIHKAIGVE